MFAASLNIVKERPQFVCRDLDSLATIQLVNAHLHVPSKLRLPALQFAENLQACGDNLVLGTIFPCCKLLLYKLFKVRGDQAYHCQNLSRGR